MMLYLTGSQQSISKNPVSPQNDPGKSLGGYISSSPVPNSGLNVLFDMISLNTLDKKNIETIGLGLINEFNKPVTNVTLKIISKNTDLAFFKVAAVSADNYSMEYIQNRYQEPISAEFHDVNFSRAGVNIQIISGGTIGEEIILNPFDIVINIIKEGVEGVWESFLEAFSNDEIYNLIRLSENVFRIERKDELILEDEEECSYLNDGNFSAVFQSKLKNDYKNYVTIIENGENFLPKNAIGIWLQRHIKNNVKKSDEDLIQQYLQKTEIEEIEEIELIISYNIVELSNYNQDYQQEQYS